MSEYYYYGMAAVMLLTTCWTLSAARWGYPSYIFIKAGRRPQVPTQKDTIINNNVFKFRKLINN